MSYEIEFRGETFADGPFHLCSTSAWTAFRDWATVDQVRSHCPHLSSFAEDGECDQTDVLAKELRDALAWFPPDAATAATVRAVLRRTGAGSEAESVRVVN